MELKEYQDIVKKFVDANNIQSSVENRLIDVYSELGEVSKEILKGNSYGKKEFIATEDLYSEVGDVMFSLICLANLLEIDLGKSLEEVLKKYKKRLMEKGDIGSGE